MSAYNLFVSGPKFTKFFLFNKGGVVVHFQFSLCGSIPEIFAIKVEHCEKSRKILDVFCPPKFCWGQPFQNYCRRYHRGLEAHHLVKFHEVTPTTP